ncbi:phage tail tip lysozyme [Megasphaera massiliensis]|jgi:hypothetical protein|uniref:phage tail tip lysozyme n=1 Tax=Megasphaera massiliensis TaxID=1232428 RepID=UPI0025981143|nr:phage tail tip lysozyme [uncultured Megasphaera sp.]
MAVSENMSLVYNWFLQRGYSPTLAAGFAANFAVETGGGEDIIADIYNSTGNGAYGIAQWLDPSRQQAFNDYMNESGLDGRDIYNQLSFVDYELHNQYAGALESIQNSDLSTPELAAAAIAKYYEQCEEESYAPRQAVAGEIFSTLHDGSSYDPSSTGGGQQEDVDYTSYLPEDLMGIDSSMYGRLGMVFAKAKEMGIEPILTAGANDSSHVEGSWHYKGLGADIAWNGLEWGDSRLKELADYARSIGFQEVIDDQHGTGPHLHIANPDLSKEVEAVLGPKGSTYTFGEGVYAPQMKTELSPEFMQYTQQKFEAQRAYEEALKAKPSIIEGIWHDFKRSGNFGYEFVDALYSDLFHSDWDAFGRQKITEEDKQYIKAAMGKDNSAEAQWIIDNAKDPTQLYYLLQKKSDEMAEDRKYAAYYSSIGSHNIGTVLGAILDPLNLLPEVKAIQSARIMQKLGGTVKNVEAIDRAASAAAKAIVRSNPSKVADTAVHLAAMGAIQQHAANMANGDDNSIAGAALIAGVSGGVLRTLGLVGGKYLHKDPALNVIAKAANRTQEATAREAAGLKSAYSILEKSREVAARVHDASFFKGHSGKVASTMSKRDNVFALSLKDAKALGNDIGVNVTNNAKGFYVPHGDYVVVIKDNIKSTKELEGVLAHEVGVHQSLKITLGDEQYGSLMDYIKKQQQTPNSTFAQAARKAGSTDPEEVLGYAVENGMLGSRAQSKVAGAFRAGLKALGIKGATYNNKDIMSMVEYALKYNKLRDMGIIVNNDGTVIQNGVKFSKDNLVAPESLMDYERMISEHVESMRSTSAGGRVLDWLSKKMDSALLTRTPFGTGYHSPSPTLAKKTAELWEDAQRRGATRNGSAMPSAERMKMAILSKINKPVWGILDARQSWIKNHYGVTGVVTPFKGGDAHRSEFDKLVIDIFNKRSTQRTNINIDDALVDDDVMKAVKHLEELYQTRIDVGMESASIFGGKIKNNLVEQEWYPVSSEFHRLVDVDAYRSFVSNFATTGDKGAQEFLHEYALRASNTPTSRSLIRDMIARERNLQIQRQIDSRLEYLNGTGKKSAEKVERVTAEVAELRKKSIESPTEADIDAFREAKAKEWADNIMRPFEDAIDGISADGTTAKLGDLTFFRGRLPMDTGMTMPIKDAEGNVIKDFSFDNDLRLYDLEHILNRTNNRFAGEAAVRATIGDANAYDKFIKTVLHEFKMASMGSEGRISSSTAAKHSQYFLDNMARLRGMQDSYSRKVFDETSAVTKILNNLAYFKRGGSMGWNQLGDLGGAIAYGGLKQVFGVFNPVRKFVQDVRLGKANSKFVEDLQWHIFGEPLERHIFRGSWGDKQARNALSQRGHSVGNVLAGVSDFTHNIGKITSQINLLGHMTDTMVRSMRSGALTDAIRWAHGEKFGAFRNPFSKANIKALGRPVDLEALKADIRKYIQWDGQKGTIAKNMNVMAWKRDNPKTFWEFYDLIQNQAEKGVLLSTSEGNRNMLKDMNNLARMAFMFKDFAMRSNNAQFMRSLQQHEVQDALAFGLSMATNAAAFAARNGAKMATLYALGNTEAADYIRDNYLNDMALAKAAFLRTGFLAPLSSVNDIYEGATGAPTIRTTVTQYRQNKRPQDLGDYAGNMVQQLPSVDTFSDMFVKPALAAQKLATDKGTQKDLRAIMNLAPVPDFIPYTQMIDTLSKLSDLPSKRR